MKNFCSRYLHKEKILTTFQDRRISVGDFLCLYKFYMFYLYLSNVFAPIRARISYYEQRCMNACLLRSHVQPIGEFLFNQLERGRTRVVDISESVIYDEDIVIPSAIT